MTAGFFISILLLAVAVACRAITRADEAAERVSLARFGDNEAFSVEERRYLLYNVNPGEGFNLRRDVHMRVANAVRQLRERGLNYVLVLPPWGGLYHWRDDETLRKHRHYLPWRRFFDVASLNRHVPSIEFERFLAESGRSVELILYLQPYAEGWDPAGGFQMKYDRRPCVNAVDRYYRRDPGNGRWLGHFFSYGDPSTDGGGVTARRLECLSVQGQSSTLADAIQRNFSKPLSILVERAETILHDHFGDVHYWRARRSMRYSKDLLRTADALRESALTSTDIADGLRPPHDNWEAEGNHGYYAPLSVGGRYLCAHWRRADFLRAHGAQLPSVNGTAVQIARLAGQLGVDRLFLSTDASADEICTLNDTLAARGIRVVRFTPSDLADGVKTLSDGEISIIDQWICAHAVYFVGTHVSTFSFRIQEDREIIGFHPSTTFNRLCPDAFPDRLNAETAVKEAKSDSESDDGCEQPAKWTIVYE